MNPRHLVGQSCLRAVIGGFHLGDASPQLVAATIEGFRELLPTAIHPLHCTGEPATRALVQALPDRCHPIGVGSVMEF
jgi:7,8-dihydropterin-6-yl-methyl-4-(beta-D-ribofuranosyl)aminobenzene 5'-phosphate synthase